MTTYPTQPETLLTAADLAADTAAAANWRTLLRLLSDNGIASNTPAAIVTDMLLAALPGPTVQIERAPNTPHGTPLATITYPDMTAHLAVTRRGELIMTAGAATYLIRLEDLVLHLLQYIPTTAVIM